MTRQFSKYLCNILSNLTQNFYLFVTSFGNISCKVCILNTLFFRFYCFSYFHNYFQKINVCVAYASEMRTLHAIQFITEHLFCFVPHKRVLSVQMHITNLSMIVLMTFNQLFLKINHLIFKKFSKSIVGVAGSRCSVRIGNAYATRSNIFKLFPQHIFELCYHQK